MQSTRRHYTFLSLKKYQQFLCVAVMIRYAITAVWCISMLISGCGNSNNSKSSNQPKTRLVTAEGIWDGTTSTNKSALLIVLENGETWAVYGKGEDSSETLFGHTTSNNGHFSGSGFDVIGDTVITNFAGTFASKSNLNLKVGSGETITATYNPDYDQSPPALSAIAGNYSGQALTTETRFQPISTSISSSGTIHIPTTAGCSATGTINPRATGKNIYDVTVVFKGQRCAVGNGETMRGIGSYDANVGQVMLLALNSDKSDGFIFLGAVGR
jgi:hypothetical protein